MAILLAKQLTVNFKINNLIWCKYSLVEGFQAAIEQILLKKCFQKAVYSKRERENDSYISEKIWEGLC